MCTLLFFVFHTAPAKIACAGQKRLTNVALVRYRKFGIRLEIATFPNTVLSWRQGMYVAFPLSSCCHQKGNEQCLDTAVELYDFI